MGLEEMKNGIDQKIASSHNTNSILGNSRFGCVKNNTPFMDVDTLKD